ncbi:DsbE family thiol:disulfide interchange protein [Mesorhizobium sp. NBSH29]|uniref:DsbE family thiol:disulfide interchange protein n=1 Tax=Mesorhizobium sp. NBSH29 TaxID=2654249 RepID=UPI0018966979|nr:DsbE family thiol:disulfide interchange protein [Mesorhizobium sp. NBSH29]QPC86017.1 DsbE family thiol:disulfide interchange protein [Mesorhizobium sp. NBSH29]
MSSENQSGEKSPRRLVVLLPLVIFLGLAATFLIQLTSGSDISAVPSALIGQKAPATSLPALADVNLPGLDAADFAGQVTLVNVFASWCGPCRDEHPLLLALARDGRFAIAGLNYKDKPDNARRFLGELGNPYTAIGVDAKGRTAIDWGVYGVPETFLVGKDGTIVEKYVGPLNSDALRNRLMPAIEKALAVPG